MRLAFGTDIALPTGAVVAHDFEVKVDAELDIDRLGDPIVTIDAVWMTTCRRDPSGHGWHSAPDVQLLNHELPVLRELGAYIAAAACRDPEIIERLMDAEGVWTVGRGPDARLVRLEPA